MTVQRSPELSRGLGGEPATCTATAPVDRGLWWSWLREAYRCGCPVCRVMVREELAYARGDHWRDARSIPLTSVARPVGQLALFEAA